MKGEHWSHTSQINKVIISMFQNFHQHVPNYSFHNCKRLFWTIWQLSPTLANVVEFLKEEKV